MKKFLVLCAVFAAVSASAISYIPARFVSNTQPTNIAPASTNAAALFAWLDANFPTNISPSNVYFTASQVSTLVSTSSVPGTNIVGATYSNGTWTVTASATAVLTNTSIVQLFTTITNGAPIMVQYLSLTNSQTTWQYSGNGGTWSGTDTEAVTSWVTEASSGSGMTFDSGSTVTIPTGHVAISFFSGGLKDTSTNTPSDSYVRFQFTSGSSDASVGTMFMADREDAEDGSETVWGGDSRLFPLSSPAARTLRVQAYHVHGYSLTNTVTRHRAVRWQLLLLQAVPGS